MKLIVLDNEMERQAAYQLRARAYRKFLPEGTQEFKDEADNTAFIFGAFLEDKIIGTVRINHGGHKYSRMPFEPFYDTDPPDRSVEVSRLCIDPDIINPVKQAMIVSKLMKSWYEHCKLYGTKRVYAAATNKTAKHYASLLGFIVVDRAIYPPAKIELELMAADMITIEHSRTAQFMFKDAA